MSRSVVSKCSDWSGSVPGMGLQQVDTTDVPPTAHSIVLQTVVRDDEVLDSLPPDQILANAPQKEAGFFKVKAVLE